MRACRVRRHTGGMARAVGSGLTSLCHHGVMVKMALRPNFMNMFSYHFCSDLLLVLRRGASHPGRHRITDPAAHRQQRDQEDEEQVAHGLM